MTQHKETETQKTQRQRPTSKSKIQDRACENNSKQQTTHVKTKQHGKQTLRTKSCRETIKGPDNPTYESLRILSF